MKKWLKVTLRGSKIVDYYPVKAIVASYEAMTPDQIAGVFGPGAPISYGRPATYARVIVPGNDRERDKLFEQRITTGYALDLVDEVPRRYRHGSQPEIHASTGRIFTGPTTNVQNARPSAFASIIDDGLTSQ